MTTFSTNDRVATPTNRLGTVQPAPWFMPHHVLVKLDGQTEPRWLLTDILQLVERCPAQPEPQPAAEPSPVAQIAQLSLFQESEAA